MIVGIIGNGVVGSLIARTYTHFKITSKVYDIDPSRSQDSLNSLTDQCASIFVCVPTPTEEHTQVGNHVSETIKKLSILRYKGVVIIKSTVLPGTTRKLAEKYPNLHLVHSPEFLNESSEIFDVVKAPQIILGFKDLSIDQSWVEDVFKPFIEKGSIIVRCLYEQSEIIKYGCNVFYSTKNAFFNLMKLVCDHFDVEYELVRNSIVKNGWVHPMHTYTPGRDGLRGFGGACLPKDLAAFETWCLDNKLPFGLLDSVRRLNQILREMPREEEKTDWESHFYGI